MNVKRDTTRKLVMNNAKNVSNTRYLCSLFNLFFFPISITAVIDECAFNNGGCGHLCIDTQASFACACPVGFELERNGISCRGKYNFSILNLIGIFSK